MVGRTYLNLKSTLPTLLQTIVARTTGTKRNPLRSIFLLHARGMLMGRVVFLSYMRGWLVGCQLKDQGFPSGKVFVP